MRGQPLEIISFKDWSGTRLEWVSPIFFAPPGPVPMNQEQALSTSSAPDNGFKRLMEQRSLVAARRSDPKQTTSGT